MKKHKLCYACRSLVFEPGSPGCSEMTPGAETKLYCSRGKWDAMDGTHGGAGLMLLAKTAETCSLFKEADWVKKEKRS